METIIAALTITAAAAIVLLLATLRAGTRRQERTGSLSCHAPGPAAKLARRITGLYAEAPHAIRPPTSSECRQP